MGSSLCTLRDWATSRGIKRKAGNYLGRNALNDEDFDQYLHTPKRRKLTTTSEYIYKTLFDEGQNSDVTIVALGTEWNLHRVYLCQSAYFHSMFSGSWKEANEGVITVGIEDENITVEALRVVFGSLYKDEVSIEPAEVISILSAATLFQLDSLIQQCSEIMAETISMQTVLKYQQASFEYGLQSLQKKSLDWLLRNLTVTFQDSIQYLRQIDPDLMARLLSSPYLVTIQTEFSLYILLKIWIFVRENPSWTGSLKEATVEAHKYFQTKPGGEGASFLECAQGEQYLQTFRHLRLQHLLNHHLDVELLEGDAIVPMSWILPVFRNQWCSMLRVDQGVDKGPKQVSLEEFEKHCLRCGRILSNDEQHIWRWTGYNFGLDLIVTYTGRVLKFRRNHVRETGEISSLSAYLQPSQSSSLFPKRHLMYRLIVHSFNSQGHTTFTATTGLKTISLAKNEETRVLVLDKDARFPLLISANFLVTTPLHSNSSQEDI